MFSFLVVKKKSYCGPLRPTTFALWKKRTEKTFVNRIGFTSTKNCWWTKNTSKDKLGLKFLESTLILTLVVCSYQEIFEELSQFFDIGYTKKTISEVHTTSHGWRNRMSWRNLRRALMQHHHDQWLQRWRWWSFPVLLDLFLMKPCWFGDAIVKLIVHRIFEYFEYACTLRT